ncbi:MAG TPA: hypothetical protein VG167_09365 [Verrucomicrobiae bacterium]|nr:hypothetical protein [Verrucomicrobiae bacterium]
MKTASPIVSGNEFCAQVMRFCGAVREELTGRWEQLGDLPISLPSAVSFAESLLLCPTTESARACIQRDIPGALSFLFAVQGIQQRVEKGRGQLPTQGPEFQTPFFLLASAVQDYLESVAVPAGT